MVVITEQEQGIIQEDIIGGRNSVREALKAGRSINRVYFLEDNKSNIIRELIFMVKSAHIPFQWVDKPKLDKLAKGLNHQGVIALVASHNYVELEDILRKAGENPFILILDGINDPHNLGAILRTAEAAGVDGVIIPKRRAVGINATVSKVSAGAVEYVSVARVSNIASTIDFLKKKDFWVIGAHLEGNIYWQEKLTGPIALVIGGEDKGLGRLIKDKCDILISIPMLGKGSSLNASVAASLCMYEILRQRN